MKVRYATGKPPVDFFREGIGFVLSPKSCLNVADRNLSVKSSQAADKRRRRVSLHENHIGLAVNKRIVERSDDVLRQSRERLLGFHDIEIVVGFDSKHVEDLVEHMPVLCRRDVDCSIMRMFLKI